MEIERAASAVQMRFVDASAIEPGKRDRVVRRLVRQEVWQPFDLANGPLLRVSLWRTAADVHVLTATVHHIIADAWSVNVLLREVTSIYASLVANRPTALPPLPIQYGVRRAAWMISPSFVVPFLMIPLGAMLHILTGSFWLLQILGALMTAYGCYVCYLMLRRPEDLAVEENHVSWAHMYRMMFVAQIGFALAYLL